MNTDQIAAESRAAHASEQLYRMEVVEKPWGREKIFTKVAHASEQGSADCIREIVNQYFGVEMSISAERAMERIAAVQLRRTPATKTIATVPRDCGEDTKRLEQEICDLAYRVICEHSGECEIVNLPNEMQCRIDAAMKSQTDKP